MIEAKSDWMWMVLAHIHNVGAQFFLSITLLFLSLTVYVIFGLFLKYLYGAEYCQNRRAVLGEQFLSVLPSPAHGYLMKQIQESWKWSVTTCKQLTWESLNAYTEPGKMDGKAMGGWLGEVLSVFSKQWWAVWFILQYMSGFGNEHASEDPRCPGALPEGQVLRVF